MNTFRLPYSTTQEILALSKVLDVYELNELKDPNVQRQFCQGLFENLAGRIKESLLSRLIEYDYLVIKELPLVREPLLFVALGSLLGYVGDPYQNPDHSLVQDIYPREKNDPNEILHSDDTGFRNPAIYTILWMVKPDLQNQGHSLILRARDLIKQLKSDAKDDLIKKLFTIRVPFKLAEKSESGFEMFPLLGRKGDDLLIRYGFTDITEGMNLANLQRSNFEAVASLVREFETELKSVPRTKFNLSKGDVLIFRNRCVLHGRTKIMGTTSTRHLKRIKVYEDWI